MQPARPAQTFTSTPARSGPRVLTCFHCNQIGHKRSECPQRFQVQASSQQNQTQGQGSGIVCYRCGQTGHVKRYCPRSQGTQGASSLQQFRSQQFTHGRQGQRPPQAAASYQGSRVTQTVALAQSVQQPRQGRHQGGQQGRVYAVTAAPIPDSSGQRPPQAATSYQGSRVMQAAASAQSVQQPRQGGHQRGQQGRVYAVTAAPIPDSSGQRPLQAAASYQGSRATQTAASARSVQQPRQGGHQGGQQSRVYAVTAAPIPDLSVGPSMVRVPNVHGWAKKKFVAKERVAEIIDDAYRKLQGAATTSASKNGDSSLEINNMKPEEEVVDSVYLEKKVRCPCGSSVPTEDMIQCVDLQCRVLQHIGCVIIPEECSEGIPPIPSQFYCEICRINRADPFWVTVKQLLSPVRLILSNISTDWIICSQNLEKEFLFTSEDIHLLQNKEYDVQVWCILLNDKVSFRMQWPLCADIKVNGVSLITASWPKSQLLRANGRDDGPMIASHLGKGINQISLLGCDARSFCLGVRVVKKRTIQQILNLILKKQNGEPFEDALARVCRCIGGKMASANEDSDSDLEVIADCVTVNLRCPMSASRIKTASRFRPCAHMGCFDLETFVQLNQLSRKWQCPICMKNYSWEDITIDPYFNRITKMVQDCGEDVTEIDVKPDGSWRAKNGYQFRNHEQWHLPDGSICVSTIEVVSDLEALRLNEEGVVGHINPKQVSKHRDIQTSSQNQPGEYFENYSQNVIILISSSSESDIDDEDCKINLDGIGNFNLSANNGHEIDIVSHNFVARARTMNRNTCTSLRDLDVIVLSDSEEENANLTYPETVSITRGIKNGHALTSNCTIVPDPPQQIMLPTQPPRLSKMCDLGNNPQTSNALLPPSINDKVKSNGTTNVKRSPSSFPCRRQPRTGRHP